MHTNMQYVLTLWSSKFYLHLKFNLKHDKYRMKYNKPKKH